MINFDKFDRRAKRMGFSSTGNLLEFFNNKPISRQTWWRWSRGTSSIKMDSLFELMNIMDLKDYR